MTGCFPHTEQPHVLMVLFLHDFKGARVDFRINFEIKSLVHGDLSGVPCKWRGIFHETALF